jgi:hypothetical protein
LLVRFSEATTGFRPWREGLPQADEDIFADFTGAKYRGISLYGTDPAMLIGELRRDDYLQSIHIDIDWVL